MIEKNINENLVKKYKEQSPRKYFTHFPFNATEGQTLETQFSLLAKMTRNIEEWNFIGGYEIKAITKNIVDKVKESWDGLTTKGMRIPRIFGDLLKISQVNCPKIQNQSD